MKRLPTDFELLILESKVIYEDDGDRIIIAEYDEDDIIGKIVLNLLYEPYTYEFNYDFTEEEYEEIFDDADFMIKIEHIEVDDGYKRTGIAKKLMSDALKFIKKKNVKMVYLNASPMGFSGLGINDLVKFYEKFKFKTIKDQGHNVQMLLKI